MTFDWAEYLPVADSLARLATSHPGEHPEAYQRAAVSRAYYAAFGCARRYLRSVAGVMVSPRGDAHRAVAGAFMDGSDEQRFQVGAELARLRLARNQCDYDDEVVDLATITDDAIRRAAALLRQLDQL